MLQEDAQKVVLDLPGSDSEGHSDNDSDSDSDCDSDSEIYGGSDRDRMTFAVQLDDDDDLLHQIVLHFFIKNFFYIGHMTHSG